LNEYSYNFCFQKAFDVIKLKHNMAVSEVLDVLTVAGLPTNAGVSGVVGVPAITFVLAVASIAIAGVPAIAGVCCCWCPAVASVTVRPGVTIF
jgi:hypothetical protein